MKTFKSFIKPLFSRMAVFYLSIYTAVPAIAQPMDHSHMHHSPAEEDPGAASLQPSSGAEAPPTDTHSAHSQPTTLAPRDSAEPMDHTNMGHTLQPTLGDPVTPIPPITEGDRAAAVPPRDDHPVHDNSIQHYLLLDRIEAGDIHRDTQWAWEGQGWIGTDLNRLWLRSEGERNEGRTEAADVEVLYGRSIAPWWDIVAGIRQDFKPGDAQSFAAIGVQGLSPMQFEVAATLYVGEQSQTEARLEVEYDLLITNRWILQPLIEVNLFGKDDPERGIGAGLGTAEAGLRLRYEITRQFAPYIGVAYERAFGNTANLRRDDSESVNDAKFVIGLRTWF